MSLKNYTIDLDDDTFVTEEALVDPFSGSNNLEIPLSRKVFTKFFVLIILILAIFVVQAFRLQIIDGKKYSAIAAKYNAPKNSILTLRGIIYDTNGIPLVENQPALDLITFSSEFPKKEEERADIIESISNIIKIPIENLKQIISTQRGLASFIIKSDLNKEEAIAFYQKTLPGIYIVPRAKRNYIYGPAISHIIGYTSKVSQDDIKRDYYYGINDRIGKLGIESSYESELRGIHKSIVLTSNEATGYSTIETGDNITLNIDKDIQEQLFKATANILKAMRIQRGAAVVQNPKTGAILGMVSFPTFDPNIFENSEDQNNVNTINALLIDKNRPLFNRIISGRYSPGSTIKPLYALAGLQEKIVTPQTLVYAAGSITVKSKYDSSVSYTFRDWKVHGWTDIRKAIADSVDVYFYALGGGYEAIKGIGINKIVQYLSLFRANKSTGIDLGNEQTGFIPTEEWKQRTKNTPWYIGDTYNLSIGQGDFVVTPLWINSYISALANGGTIFKPFVMRKITDNSGNTSKEIEAEAIATLPIDPASLKVVIEGMHQTTISGTATILKNIPVNLAAKTGTAQITGHNLNSLFTVFGPTENPEISMTVIAEDINNQQGVTIQIANDFLSWYFNDRLTKNKNQSYPAL